MNGLSALAFIFLISSCALKKNNMANTTGQTPSIQSEISSENKSQVIQVVDAKEFNKLLASNHVQLIDVRTPAEYQEGHIENAVNMNVNQEDFNANLSKLDKTKPVLVYCKSGKRSANAAEIMKKAGFTKIMDFEGGILAWEEAKLPIKK